LSDARELFAAFRAPGEDVAEDRSLDVARRAFLAREPAPRERRVPVLVFVAIAACAAIAAITVTPAGSWIRDRVGRETVTVEAQRPALASLPAPGRLLVTSERGTWVVRRDGSRRFLGAYRAGASWSPHGLFVVAWNNRELVALEPDATDAVRWSLSRPAIAGARWSPSGFRVAYLSGARLRVVAGDGTGDSVLARSVAPVAPSWRPGGRHELAFVDRGGRVVVVDTDTRRRHWRAQRLPEVVGLNWTNDGRRLLAATDAGLLLLRPGSARPARLMARETTAVVALAVRPGTGEVAYSTFDPKTLATRVVLTTLDGRDRSLLFAGQGEIPELVWSPDGSYLLASWPVADQWLFLPAEPDRRPRGVTGVTQLFAPAARGARSPSIGGWSTQ